MPLPSLLRFRYSLRALLVLMTLLAIWLGYSMNWIRQRRQLIESGVVTPYIPSNGAHCVTPVSLGILGERGYTHLMIDVPHGNAEFNRIQALFPEARCNGNITQSGNPL